MSRLNGDAAERVELRPRTMYLLNQANQAVRTRFEQALRPIGLTGIQYTVLSIVEAREGISSAELSRRFFVTAQTMNEIVTGLERRELLERQHDPRSKRILTATLTRAGRELLVQADAVADRVERAAFRHLSDDDFLELRRVLGVLLADLRNADQARPDVVDGDEARVAE